jgi:hypothetical protein
MLEIATHIDTSCSQHTLLQTCSGAETRECLSRSMEHDDEDDDDTDDDENVVATIN